MQALKLLVVDDHKAAREALVKRLSTETDIQVDAVPASAPEALNDALDQNPDVVLLDIKIHSGDGLQLCRDMLISYPNIKVMILTSCASPQEFDEAQEIGVADYLFKDLDIASLLVAIRKAN